MARPVAPPPPGPSPGPGLAASLRALAEAVALALVTSVVAWSLLAGAPGRNLSDAVDDVMMSVLARPARYDDVAVVDFDDASLAALKPALGAWPFGRDVHAALIDFLREAGAKAIVVDLVFEDAREGDGVLARRLAGHGDVVLAAAGVRGTAAVPAPMPLSAGVLDWAALTLPSPPLMAALSGPAPVGVITSPLDADGRLRRLPLLHAANGRTWPSLALAALAAQAGVAPPLAPASGQPGELALGRHRWPIDAQGRVRLVFPAATSQVPRWPARAVIDAALGRIDGAALRAAFHGRTVFVGSSAFLGDRVLTAQGQLAGVDVFASEFDALRHDDVVRDAPAAWTLALCTLALLPVLLSGRRWKPSLVRDAAVAAATGVAVVALALALLAGVRVLVPVLPAATLLLVGLTVTALAELGRSLQENRRLAEARRVAEAANAAKSDFLASVSHELRTPLHAMLGMADALRRSPLSAEQVARLDVLRQAGGTLATLIDDLLDLARIEADRLVLHPEPFALAPWLATQVALLEPRAAEKGLALKWHIAEDAGDWVHGDPHRLGQVVLNLVGNAIKFTQRGEVGISLDRPPLDGGLLHLAVRDTGIGIARSKLESIFEPFSQADGSITRHFGGTGLGLSITRRLAAMMGGRVWVDSVPGQGSVFHVTANLPVVAAPSSTAGVAAPPASASPSAIAAAPAPAPSTVRLGAPGVAVLLAEDNEVNVLVMRALLEGTRHTLRAVPNGETAIESFRRGRFGLVLMDLHMPGIDGYAATRALRAIEAEEGRPRTAIVALTASALEGDRAASRAAGCDDHLVKPIGREALLAAIARHGRPMDDEGLPPAAAPATAHANGVLDDAAALRAAGGDVERRERHAAHARVFLGTWQRQHDAAVLAADRAAQARSVDELLASAQGLGAHALVAAAQELRDALAAEDSPGVASAREAVADALRRVIAALAG